jgi:hypothetical protein
VDPASEESSESPTALWIASLALGGAVLSSWVAQVRLAPMNTDAGFYVPHALLVLQGEVPYRNFPSGYAPGIYYLLALLGEEGLRSPLALKLCAFFAQVLNSLLVYSVLRRIDTRPQLSLLFTACFAGLTTAAWGMAFQLEAFLNLFTFFAFWLLLREPHPLRGAAAGLSLGCAVMIKQYALLAMPAVLLASLIPLVDTGGNTAPSLRRGRGLQLGVLLAAIPLPYFVFLLATGLDPVENFIHLATFGGGVSSYGALSLSSLWETLVAGTLGRFLLPTLCCAAWLFWRSRSWRCGVLCLGLVPSLLPLYVWPFDYYVQLALPWSIFILAEFSRVAGGRFQERAAATRLVAVLVALPLLGIIWSGSRTSFDPVTTISDQIEIAGTLEEEIGSSEDVLVLNAAWLYTLTRFVPPLKDYSFNLNPQTDELRRKATQFAIIFVGSQSARHVVAWLAQDGMSLRKRLQWQRMTIYILDRESR